MPTASNLRILALVLAAASNSACQGDIGGPTLDDDGNTDPGSCESAPPRVGLQRLTRAEYNRTVRDLFGVTSNPADLFPPDSSTSGFDNNAKSLTTSPQLALQLLDAAETVAKEALTSKRDEILICDSVVDGYDECARTTLAALARRVYRRPATDAEIEELMGLMDFAEAEGDSFDTGIEYALTAMLVAPQFLFRGIPVTTSSNVVPLAPLDDFALATRLSYFVWGSTPDDALLDRAEAGELNDDAALREEFNRLLADPKADALFDGFVTQWLALGKLSSATPDPTMFPGFDEALRQHMADEPRRFFADLRARDGSALELINGTRTFANESLARIYGVSGVTGDAFVPITTDKTQRAGLLTMPAVLTMTSGPTSPNIVKRGVWLAETFLCASPPPPADGVPAEPVPKPGETERERLARHRLDPSCASCHDLIDPLGFGFENYDAIGQWRTMADGKPVDNLGSTPDGETFAGIPELAALLASGGTYGECVTEKLMTYALGRTLSSSEQCLLTAIGESTVTPDSKLSDLLWAVVESDAFRMEEKQGAP